MAFPVDLGGLRRRSPNPNSPDLEDAFSPTLQPFPPAAPSPNFQDDSHGLSASFSPNPARSPASVYTPWQATTPTIRLIPSSSQGGSDHPPTPITLDSRSRFDDHEDRTRQSPSSPPPTSLFRHVTDPNYSYLRRADAGAQPQACIISREHRDKPVPPLPLDMHRVDSDGGSTLGSEMDMGKSDGDSVEVASAGTGRRTWSSLLVNPFILPLRRGFSSASSSTKLRPLHLLARPMGRSTSSASSRSDLVSSTEANPYRSFLLNRNRTLSTSTSLNDEMMARVKSASGDKVTAKFPERSDTDDGEWTSFKIVLLLSVMTLFGYGLAGLCWALRVMLRISQHSDVTMVSDPDVITFLLLFSLLCLFTSFVGLTGTLLSSRPILAFYNLLLWPTFISLALVGYTSFKRSNLQLDRKLNQVWSQFLSDEDRLRIQNSLGCCGYYNPFHDATYSKKCYPRTALSGCKAKWTLFEARALQDFATAAFSTVPIHVINIIVALVCSNHVDRQFGKGITPLKYRLQAADVRANAIAMMQGRSSSASIARSVSKTSLLRRSVAMRGSRRSQSSQTSSSTITLLPNRRRQSSFDSFGKQQGHDGTPGLPFEDGLENPSYPVRRVATDDFDLPRPPPSRLSSLTFGRRDSEHPHASSRRRAEVHDVNSPENVSPDRHARY